jgi:hypothetical protein
MGNFSSIAKLTGTGSGSNSSSRSRQDSIDISVYVDGGVSF